jgi:TonB family protein
VRLRPNSRFRLGCILAVALIVSVSLFAPVRGFAEDGRKVKSRVSPSYPEIARQANITGIVKIEAVVSPSGDVRSTRVIGGHPMLAAAAQEALKKWKYEPASDSSTLVVQFDFKSGS